MFDDSDVLAKAALQGGVVTRRQALEAGLTSSSVDRRVASGRWVPLNDGVYRLFPSTGDHDWLAAATAVLPGAVVSHASAGALLDLRITADQPTVTVHASKTHEFGEVSIRRTRSLRPEHVTEIEGLPTTTVPRTLVDLAADLRPRTWRSLAETTLTSGRCSIAAIEEVAKVVCGRGRAGSALVSELLADPMAEASRLERKARELIARSGLPSPVVEMPVPWRPTHRFDLAYPDARLAIELDGRAFHVSPERFGSDRFRDREAATHGWLVVRFTWDDVVHRASEFVRTVATLLSERTVG